MATQLLRLATCQARNTRKLETLASSMAQYLYDTDILDVDMQVIVQQCHCQSANKIAKGLAASIAERFPYANFYAARKKNSTPGTIEMRGGKGVGRFICAFYAQINPGGPGKEKDTEKSRVAYFAKCLVALGKVKNLREIAFPYGIGCGLARGDWDVYSGMIEDFASDNEHIKVYVVSQDPEPEPEPQLTEDESPEEEKIDPAFIKWISRQLKEDPDLLKKFPDFLKFFQDEYHEYLHNVVEDDEVVDVPTVEEGAEVPELDWASSNLEEYTELNIPPGWEGFFNEQLDVDTGSIHELSKYLLTELQKGDIYPPLHLVYNIFHILKPEDIKVVIIGQDPYINPGEAMGISFSVPDDVEVPSSLRNIYKEMKDDGFEVEDPTNGNLMRWCEQGVFLINSALTVRAHESGSHSKKWNESFSSQLMRWLSDARASNPLVVIMWGGHAQNFAKLFGEQHKKIMGVHPSGMSASRGFFGSKPFSKANKLLALLGHDPIAW